MRLTFHACSMQELVAALVASAQIADQTGLMGKYDFTLEFAGYMRPGGAFPSSGSDAPAPAGATIFDALDVQLGLRLVEKKVPAAGNFAWGKNGVRQRSFAKAAKFVP
jgi:uncharacterized protein (TIGR03435 family)